MTGRYIRKNVPVPLEVRGISREGIDGHPLPDKVDNSALPHSYISAINTAISSYHETPSGQSSPSIEETHSIICPSHVWTNGNVTERSSVDSAYSWGEDEFERQEAKHVHKLFEEIDTVLYENKGSPQHVNAEYQEWQAHFPHLRILGVPVETPQEKGYQEVAKDSPRPSSSSMLMDITDNEINAPSTALDLQHLQLAISGMPVKAVLPYTDKQLQSQTFDTDFAFLEEEVFAEDGLYEDIIAVDYKDIYEDISDKKQLTPRRRRTGYPPLTPNACAKDSVASLAFDKYWTEIISVLRNIVQKYAAEVLVHASDDDPIPNQSADFSLDATETGPSREDSILFPPRTPILRTQTAIGGIYPQPKTVIGGKLQEVLQISSKKIVIREKSNLNDPSESQFDPSARPASSVVRSRPASVWPRPFGRSRLPPMPMAERSKTPGNEDEQIAHGKEVLNIRQILPSSNDRLPSPLGNVQRHSTLPPIPNDSLDPPPSRIQKRFMPNRAASAQVREFYNRERSNLTAESRDARPSTTLALRNDTGSNTLHRRSSTPLDFRGPQQGVFLGVHGNSLQPHSDISHSDHIPQESLEDIEYGMMHTHNHWTPTAPRVRRQRITSLVRS